MQIPLLAEARLLLLLLVNQRTWVGREGRCEAVLLLPLLLCEALAPLPVVEGRGIRRGWRQLLLLVGSERLVLAVRGDWVPLLRWELGLGRAAGGRDLPLPLLLLLLLVTVEPPAPRLPLSLLLLVAGQAKLPSLRRKELLMMLLAVVMVAVVRLLLLLMVLIVVVPLGAVGRRCVIRRRLRVVVVCLLVMMVRRRRH